MSTLAIPGIADDRPLQMLEVRATELRGGDIMGGSAWRRVASVTVYNDEDHTSVNVITQYLDGRWVGGRNDMVGDLLVPILRPEPFAPPTLDDVADALEDSARSLATIDGGVFA